MGRVIDDYTICAYCGEFVEWSDTVTCGCGSHYCSMSCAQRDHYTECNCEKFGIEKPEEFLCQDFRKHHNCEKITGCDGCSYYNDASCAYCRGEKMSDHAMIEHIAHKEGITVEELMKRCLRESHSNYNK